MRTTTLALGAAFAVTSLAQDSFSLGAPSVSITIADPSQTDTIGFTDSNVGIPTGDNSISRTVLLPTVTATPTSSAIASPSASASASASDSFSVSILPTEHHSVATSEYHASHGGLVTVTVVDTNCVTTPTATAGHGHTQSFSNGTATATETSGDEITTPLTSSVGSTGAVPTKPVPSNPVPVSGAGKMRLEAGIVGLVGLVLGMYIL